MHTLIPQAGKISAALRWSPCAGIAGSIKERFLRLATWHTFGSIARNSISTEKTRIKRTNRGPPLRSSLSKPSARFGMDRPLVQPLRCWAPCRAMERTTRAPAGFELEPRESSIFRDCLGTDGRSFRIGLGFIHPSGGCLSKRCAASNTYLSIATKRWYRASSCHARARRHDRKLPIGRDRS